MDKTFDFESIRPYRDNEIHDVITSLLNEPQLVSLLPVLFPGQDIEKFKQHLLGLQNIHEFQSSVIKAYLDGIEKIATDGVELNGFENIDTSKAYIFISNHRDIILDSAFLNTHLIAANVPLTEIAIGDNLLIFEWIRKLVRLNRSFIVERNLPVRQQLDSSLRLSAYIRDSISNRNRSVWIAQREGRAKDSNDRTQVALLKMFNMSGNGTFAENFKEISLCPLSITYEYDPCDYLKAKEFQQKRDDASYKKSQADDLLNMKTGVLGKKGRVRFQITGPMDKEIGEIVSKTSVKNEQLTMLADAIDRRIHKNYSIFPNNKVAYDELFNENRFAGEYTKEEKQRFDDYLEGQLQKIELENKDSVYLRTKMLEMYANPLVNHLKAIE